jgi:hypothetical protein
MSAVSRVVPGFALESDGDPVGVQLKLPRIRCPGILLRSDAEVEIVGLNDGDNRAAGVRLRRSGGSDLGGVSGDTEGEPVELPWPRPLPPAV